MPPHPGRGQGGGPQKNLGLGVILVGLKERKGPNAPYRGVGESYDGFLHLCSVTIGLMTLTTEQKLVLDTVRQVAREVLYPMAQEYDRTGGSTPGPS